MGDKTEKEEEEGTVVNRENFRKKKKVFVSKIVGKVSVCVFFCVCVYVIEREKTRERERECSLTLFDIWIQKIDVVGMVAIVGCTAANS